MPMIDSLLSKLAARLPTIMFETGDVFSWNPTAKTITFIPDDAQALDHLLHEASHALLEHTSYERDIDLIAMERDAWQYAKTKLAPSLNLRITAEVIEDDLDTYRDWLHARSTCPTCQRNGIQTRQKEYTCVSCRSIWEVNAAIGCGLKRYTKNTS